MLTPKRANTFMFFVLLYSVLSSVALEYVFLSLNLQIPITIFLIISGILSPVIPVAFYFTTLKQRYRAAIPANGLGFINAVMLTAIAVTVQPALMLIPGLGALVFPNPAAEMLGAAYTTDPAGIILTAISVIALPAVFEELLMRGIILSGYKDAPFSVAAALNALLFGMWHLSFQQFFYAFAMGYLFCYVVRLTKSIYASIYVHLLVNGIQFTLSIYSITLMSSGELPVVETAGSAYDMLLTAIVNMLPLAIMSLITVLTILYAMTQHNKRRFSDAFATERVFPRPQVFTAGFFGTVALFLAVTLIQMISTYIFNQ